MPPLQNVNDGTYPTPIPGSLSSVESKLYILTPILAARRPGDTYPSSLAPACYVLDILSIILSTLVIIAVAGKTIAKRWAKTKAKLPHSFCISASLAVSAALFSLARLILLSKSTMRGTSSAGARFVLWIMYASSLAFVMLTTSVVLQLHFNILLRKPHIAQAMNRWSEAVCWGFSAIITHPILYNYGTLVWDEAFKSVRILQPTSSFVGVMWATNYMWMASAIAYCIVVSALISVRLWPMWSRMRSLDSEDTIHPTGMAHNFEKSRHHSYMQSSITAIPGCVQPVVRDIPGHISLTNAQIEAKKFNMAHFHLLYSLKGGRNSIKSLGNNKLAGQVGNQLILTPYGTPRRRKNIRFAAQRTLLYPIIAIICNILTLASASCAVLPLGLSVAASVLPSLLGILNCCTFLLHPSLSDIWEATGIEHAFNAAVYVLTLGRAGRHWSKKPTKSAAIQFEPRDERPVFARKAAATNGRVRSVNGRRLPPQIKVPDQSNLITPLEFLQLDVISPFVFNQKFFFRPSLFPLNNGGIGGIGGNNISSRYQHKMRQSKATAHSKFYSRLLPSSNSSTREPDGRLGRHNTKSKKRGVVVLGKRKGSSDFTETQQPTQSLNNASSNGDASQYGNGLLAINNSAIPPYSTIRSDEYYIVSPFKGGPHQH